MPEEGIQYVDKKELLSFEELERIVRVFAQLGINKVRITGGEPFVRKGIMDFLHTLSDIAGIDSIHITTNGTLTDSVVPELQSLGVKSVNLSLDTLDPGRFYTITRRDSFDRVMTTLTELVEQDMPTKINMVVMSRHNIEDILPMIELTKHMPISVRFLEEMPFNGTGTHDDIAVWDYVKILEFIKSHHTGLYKVEDGPNSTSMNYKIPGYQGSVGIIASYTRLFCGSCNRIRLTPTGLLKTCLYDDGVFNIKDLLRAGADDKMMAHALIEALSHRAKDGFEAERNRSWHKISESMATIGG
jgi:cyclic pyranopterin phosphate synthase